MSFIRSIALLDDLGVGRDREAGRIGEILVLEDDVESPVVARTQVIDILCGGIDYLVDDRLIRCGSDDVTCDRLASVDDQDMISYPL